MSPHWFFAYLLAILPIGTIGAAQGSLPPHQATGNSVAPAAYQNNFADGHEWKSTGQVRVDDTEKFQGERALLLIRPESYLNKATGATSSVGPSFPVIPGKWEIRVAVKVDLHSPDNSYNGAVTVDFQDASGKAVGQSTLAEPFGQRGWQLICKEVEVPTDAVSARFCAQINKASGRFCVAGLSAVFKAAQNPKDSVDRIVFTTAQVGNMLFPDDSRVVKIEVRSSGSLPEEQRQVSCEVRDYWGAEQAATLTASLTETCRTGRFVHYEGSVNLSEVPLEEGRYYELHGQISCKESDPFTNHTSFAILPEAAANRYKPEEIPFTSRTWDQRFPESPSLTRRLGIRICNVWGFMAADPAKVNAAQIELTHELGLGALALSPAQSIEERSGNWRELIKNDGEKLRLGIRNFMSKYGHIRPLIVNLGNEPHSKGEDVKTDLEAYRIVYTEFKKIDPSVFIVGTSVGPEEEYFSNGFGQWCDAYDFHSYEGPEGVRNILTKEYPALFRKYGHQKPIWSTELGLNSQGMARQAVAALLYEKFANFFAGGGANVSWFGLFYPDPEGTNGDSFASAHNVFDSRYSKYAPKLDAVAYYNAVNSICIKKFVEDKVYANDIHAFLFRDHEKQALQICYKVKGREDVFLPLPGVGEVQMIGIDGRRSVLDAGGKGITITVSEDPLLLLYEDHGTGLAECLESPQIRLGRVANSIVRGEKASVEVLLGGESFERVNLQVPPFWEVRKMHAVDASGAPVARFEVAGPACSGIREADMAVTLENANAQQCGKLFCRPPVRGVISMELLPIPEGKGEPAGVKLSVHNNGPEKQVVTWNLTLIGEQSLKEGVFTDVKPSAASFAAPPSGTITIEGGQSAQVAVPFAGADMYKVYRVRALVRDVSGRSLTQERAIAAFYRVPKALDMPVLDGNLDEVAWKSASPRILDTRDQYFVIKNLAPLASWKGPQDLSAILRFLWDDRYLYIGCEVTDDFAGKLQKDDRLWEGDGLQLLIDPKRSSSQKPGKYDYTIASGLNGLQAWCHLSADSNVPTGDAKDIKIAAKRAGERSGNITYELAIPWSRLAPFSPAPGQDLGCTLILNEDDGVRRNAFMTWFGNAHTKDVDTVGDLILSD